MDYKQEEEEMEIPDMGPEGNFELPGVDMEGQDPPQQVVKIDDPKIPQDPSLIALEVPAETDGLTQVLTPATEGPHRSTRVMSQTDTYAPIMTGKRYEYIRTKLESQGVIHPDTHLFAQFFKTEPDAVISIMTHLSLNAGLKEWVYKAHSEAKIEMKQLQLRKTFIPMHRRYLTHEEC